MMRAALQGEYYSCASHALSTLYHIRHVTGSTQKTG